MTQCQWQAANLLIILCTGNHDHTMPVVRRTCNSAMAVAPVVSPLPNRRDPWPYRTLLTLCACRRVAAVATDLNRSSVVEVRVSKVQDRCSQRQALGVVTCPCDPVIWFECGSQSESMCPVIGWVG